MAVRAYPNPKGWPGFRTIFKHPTTGKQSSFGLDTTDRETADRYCNQLEQFIEDPTLLKDPQSPRLLAFAKRVREIIFGKEAAGKLADMEEKPRMADSDIGEIETVVVALVRRAKNEAQLIKLIAQALQDFESPRYKELNAELKLVQERLANKTSRCTDLENELARLRRATNAHVSIFVKDAYTQWKAGGDFKALATKTQKEVEYACDSFLKTLPPKMKLGELRAQHVTAWVDGLKSKDGKRELSAVTRVKMKRYVSILVSKAYRDHDLAENPMEKTGTVKGAARAPENIEAITRLDQFNEQLTTLKEIDEYWHALVATAVLAGPRYAELCWMKLDHVNFEGNYIRIAKRENGTGSKTGRERSVPIETTILQQTLKDHVARRHKEQKLKNATPAQKCDFLFPSAVTENPFKPRTLSPAGMWSDNGVFLDAWEVIANKAAKKTGHRSYWKYGPREWRHCAGTAMGYAGNDTGRISAWIGNSEDVCRRHYRRPSESGVLWPFKW